MPSKRKTSVLPSAKANRQTAQPSNPFDQRCLQSNRTTQRKAQRRSSLNKSNRIIDRRIGEKDDSLDDQSRYLFRLQRERINRVQKHNRFSLQDHLPYDDIPHESQDDFDPAEISNLPNLSDDDQLDDVLSAPDRLSDPFLTVKPPTDQNHIQSEPRTKQEVMHEVMHKSKMYKTLHQHQKFETDEQTMQLDHKLPQIMQLLAHSEADTPIIAPKISLTPKPRTASLFEQSHPNQSSILPNKAPFHYEDVYRQLAQEKRSRPSERLLTEEEAASRQRQHLIRLEKLRSSRMRDMDVDVSKKPQRGADDLVDDFNVHLSQSEESEDESQSDSHLEQPTEGADLEYLQSLSVHQLLPAANEDGRDMPFVFKKAPASAAEFQSMFHARTLKQRSLIMKRLVTCFAISLNPGKNRPKLEKITELALQRVETLSTASKRFTASIAEINMLVTHVHALGFEKIVSAWGRRQILRTCTALMEGPGTLSDRWGISDILLLKTVGTLFPASDARHPVSIPLQLLLSEGLSVKRICSIADLALATLIANILLELLAEAERFSSHLSAFVVEIFRGFTGNGSLTSILEDAKSTTEALSLSECATLLNGKRRKNKLLAGKIVNAAMCFAEELIFCGRMPHADLIFFQIPFDKLPDPMAQSVKKMFRQAREGRIALQFYKSKGMKKKMKLRNPRFTAESGVFRKRPKSSYDSMAKGDVAASAKRIRIALKKEERGLARDLRREAEVRAAEVAAEDQNFREDRDVRDKEVRAFFETQQSTWRASEKHQKRISGKRW